MSLQLILEGHVHVRIGNFSFLVEPGQNNWFWDRVNAGRWEPDTFRVFDEYVGNGTTVVDIGAWIGATALYNAHLARHVIAYEPDPIAYHELQQNIQLNPGIKNVSVVNAAVTLNAGTVKLGIRDRPGDSASSLLLASGKNWEVAAVPFEDIVSSIEGRLFIKMDIEGYEFALAAAIRRVVEQSDAIVFVAMHPHLFGIARAARIGRNSKLRKLIGSVAKRTLGRIEGFVAMRKFFHDLNNVVDIRDTTGKTVTFYSNVGRLLLGKNISPTGTLILRSRRRFGALGKGESAPISK